MFVRKSKPRSVNRRFWTKLEPNARAAKSGGFSTAPGASSELVIHDPRNRELGRKQLVIGDCVVSW
jgi:hypothetical protein